ncbi:MAG: ATP-binding cassette domain-containing protein [Gammaproteobacteria bacterium]|nr:ATP-binding cassette domain-containing protein [Gammaproteobacteria bacterium]
MCIINSCNEQQPLLSVQNLAVDFSLHGHPVPAVRDISFSINPGESVALVGESGSGKSVTSQAIMGILPNSATKASVSTVRCDYE